MPGIAVTTDEKFDSITWTARPVGQGAAMLYSREFFEIVKKRLNPGGVVVRAAVRKQPRSGKERGCHVPRGLPERHGLRQYEQWAGLRHGAVRPGREQPHQSSTRSRRSSSCPCAPVAQSLNEIGMNNVVDLFSTFAGSKQMLQPWLADGIINRDRNLKLVPRGLGVHLYPERCHLLTDVAHRRLPAGPLSARTAC